jgi:hypothetical protein
MNARCAAGYCAHRISLSYHIHAWPSGGTLDCRNIIGNIRAARLSTTGAPHRRVSLCYFIPGFTQLGDSGGILFSYWILIWKHTFVLICWFPIGKVTRLWFCFSAMSTKVKWIMVWKLWCLFTTCLCFLRLHKAWKQCLSSTYEMCDRGNQCYLYVVVLCYCFLMSIYNSLFMVFVL